MFARKRKYKRYLDDCSIPIPKTTKYRLQQSSQSISSSPASVVSLHVSGGNVQQAEQTSPEQSIGAENSIKQCESIAACQSAIDGSTEAFHATVTATNEINYTEVFDGIWSAEADENTEVGCGGREEKAESCTDSESDDNVSLSFSDSSEEIEDSESDDQESLHSGDENDSSPRKTFSAQECACMAILSLISRHCITTEAAKDIMDLMKVLCPGDDTVQSLSYADVQQVCGNCELFVYDICERCLALFPTDREDHVICSTLGCNGYVYIMCQSMLIIYPYN